MAIEKDSEGHCKIDSSAKMETGCFVCHGTGHWAREVSWLVLNFIWI